MRRRPGEVRDAIVQVLKERNTATSTREITSAVAQMIGDVPASSVRSYLRLNTPELFVRVDRAQYSLNGIEEPTQAPQRPSQIEPVLIGKAALYLDDCNAWLARQPPNSIHAVVTDPPYGLVEYSDMELGKLRLGKAGTGEFHPALMGRSNHRCHGLRC